MGWLFNRNKQTTFKNMSEIKRNRRLKIGLALGGGATRGISHIGAVKAFEEYGIKFDFIAGTSAGSLVGAFLASGKTYSEMLSIARTIKEKDIRTSKIILIPSKTTGLENLVIDHLGDINIEDLTIPFSPIIVDLVSTEEIALRKGNLAKAVAGSCAVPGVFSPVEVGNRMYADGGLQNTIPSDIPKLFGCDYVVAVDVNSTRTFGTTSTKLLDVMGASIRILMKSNAIKGYVYSDVLIKPDLKRFNSKSIDGLEEMIDEGYKATKAKIQEILELFTRKPIKNKMKYHNVLENNKNKVVSSEFAPELIQNTKEGQGTNGEEQEDQ